MGGLISVPGSKTGADVFFASLFGATLAALVLLGGYFFTFPDFVKGLGAGLILASAVLMYLNRGRDEYTMATWHAGTSSGFAVTIAWLVTASLAPGLSDVLSPELQGALGDARLLALSAITAFLLAVGWKTLKDRQ